MFNIDLKKAKAALDAGRLDEAFKMLSSTSRRFHADGQRLVDQLVAALLERGSQHYQQNRFDAARADAALAKQLGGPQIKVEQLLQQIDARDHSVVVKAVDQMQQDAIERLSKLVEKEQIEQAAMMIGGLSKSIRETGEVQRLIERMSETIRTRIATYIQNGRLDKVNNALMTLRQAGISDGETSEVRSQLKQLTEIVNHNRQADYAQALRKLKLQQQNALHTLNKFCRAR